MIMGKNPECHPERQNTPCGCFGVELSKICNELLIFESQNAESVLRISKQPSQCFIKVTDTVKHCQSRSLARMLHYAERGVIDCSEILLVAAAPRTFACSISRRHATKYSTRKSSTPMRLCRISAQDDTRGIAAPSSPTFSIRGGT